MTTSHIHVRVYPGKDDDLMEWIEGLPPGKRSQAIRDALRRGIGMPVSGNVDISAIEAVVRQTISDALRGMQMVAEQQGIAFDNNQIEESFGNKLDQLLGKF